MFKIYPVMCHLNIKFQTLYLPNQNTAIDGSWTLWKGCLSIRQYLPLKASKFGIKTFELCESRTGYLAFSCKYRQKHGPTVEFDYYRHTQNSSCSTGTLRIFVWPWTYAVDWQLLQHSRINNEAKDRTFHQLCWHIKTEQKEHPQGSERWENGKGGNYSQKFGSSHSTKMAWQKKCNYGVNIPQCRHTEGF